MVGANGENSQKSAKDGGSTVVGGFEILSRIGRGGMGAVYKARQVSLDRIVALKILPPSLAKRQDFVTRFMREARAAGQLRHPNIVGGIDIGEADGYHPGEGLLVTEVGSLGGWKGTMKTRCGSGITIPQIRLGPISDAK